MNQESTPSRIAVANFGIRHPPTLISYIRCHHVQTFRFNLAKRLFPEKEDSRPQAIYLLSQFAEGQYYNIDPCVEAALHLHEQILPEKNESGNSYKSLF